jgi:malate dehydrogenase
MGFIAIVGGGALGGAITHALARRDRVADVRLIDPHGTVARGKTLDILQSSPIDRFSTRVTAAESAHAAIGADVIVVADDASNDKEHAGEAGLALARQILRSETRAPVVFAGAAQRDLIARCVAELHVPRARVLGSAPLALESAVRAMAALMLDGTGVEVSLRVVGVPPRAAVIAWEEATASGIPLTAQLPPHVIGSLTARLPGLWPPGPYTLGSAAARIVEALTAGSRRSFSCFVALERGAVAAMPVELRQGGVERVLEPTLTRQERTMMENAMEGENP